MFYLIHLRELSVSFLNKLNLTCSYSRQKKSPDLSACPRLLRLQIRCFGKF